MSTTHICQHENCSQKAMECTLSDGDGTVEYYCPVHAAENGYCTGCGQFCGGTNSFEFVHPGWCDNCHDEIVSEEADEQDGDEYYTHPREYMDFPTDI